MLLFLHYTWFTNTKVSTNAQKKNTFQLCLSYETYPNRSQDSYFLKRASKWTRSNHMHGRRTQKVKNNDIISKELQKTKLVTKCQLPKKSQSPKELPRLKVKIWSTMSWRGVTRVMLLKVQMLIPQLYPVESESSWSDWHRTNVLVSASIAVKRPMATNVQLRWLIYSTEV